MPRKSTRGRRRYCRCLQFPRCQKNTIVPRGSFHSQTKVRSIPLPKETPLITPTDVAILYQIVRSAEQHADVEILPFRAIFAAYEKVLSENALDPDHDQIYLRFLFRLGDRREEGQSLYQSFEALLEELGFQIEFVPDEDNGPEITRTIDTEKKDDGDNGLAHGPTLLHRRSRRASFNSAYEAEDESTNAVRPRLRSRASMSRLDVSQRSVQDARPFTRATTRKTEKTHSNLSPFKTLPVRDKRDRLTAEEFANNLHHVQQRQRSTSNQCEEKTNINVQLTTGRQYSQPSMASSIGDESQAGSDVRDAPPKPSPVPLSSRPAYGASQREKIYHPSRTQLLRDADTFYQLRIRDVAREIVDKWCYAALQASNQHEHLDRLAAARDAEVLLRQAFEHWRARLHAKKQAAETERYFRHQERNVKRCRDLMLMGKAFTHWSQCTLEERRRTSDARQHVLRLKYFHAWRDITVENQWTVRHQALRKFFGVWKQRCIRRLTNDIKADLVRHENLSQIAYWQWFWTFCEKRAPEWRTGRLRSKYLLQWVAAFKTNKRQDQQAIVSSNLLYYRRCLSRWRHKTQVIHDSRRKALAFVEERQATHALQAWRRGKDYAPLAHQISIMVDWRVAGVTFAIFITRFRFEKQAEAVDRLRTARNAWTQWNDRLRWQTIAHRIDDRYCLEALYRWVIAERCLLLQRLRAERLRKYCLNKLRHQWVLNNLQRAKSCQIIEDIQTKSCLRSFLARWHSQLDTLRRDEWLAFEFHTPKATQDALQTWNQSFNHVRTLNQWAKDAQFYFVAKRMIERWRTATTESKRQKRKNAYVHARRMIKINLARGNLRRWHVVFTHMVSLQQQAKSFNQDRLLRVGTIMFDSWRDQSDFTRDHEAQADRHYSKRLLERHLYTWIERLEEQAKLEEIADLNGDLRVKNVAFGWFNSLRLKIIELKGQEANAENLRNWYEKRRMRNLLRRWQDKTSRSLRPQEETTFTSQVTRTRPRAALDHRSSKKRVEDWTDFDVGDWIPALEAQSSTTPLPGYLSTPSKRAARAKALVRVSTTPAGTPFEQRLRSQISLTPRTSRRIGFGRSVNAPKRSTFEVIKEDSPKTPDRRGNE